MFKDSKDYWKQVVEDMTSCSVGFDDLTDEEMEGIAEQIMNDDHFWINVDSAIWEMLDEKYPERRKKYDEASEN